MRRIRVSTLMLLVVIAALVTALIVQHERARRRIAELEAITGPTWKMISENRTYQHQVKQLTRRVGELEGKAGEVR